MYQPTIYKFRDNVNVDEVVQSIKDELDEDERFEIKKGKIGAKYNYILFTINSYAGVHSWTRFLQSLNPKYKPQTAKYWNFILLVSRGDKLIYSITTGQFFHKIVQWLDYKYGNHIMSRLVAIKDLGLLSQLCAGGMISGITRKLRHADESLTNNIENCNRVVKGMKGKGFVPPGRESSRDKINWSANANGGIFVPADLDHQNELPKLLEMLEDIERRHDKLGLPELLAIRSPALAEVLWKMLFDGRSEKKIFINNFSDENLEQLYIRKGKKFEQLPSEIKDYEKQFGKDLTLKAFELDDDGRSIAGSKVSVERCVRGTLEYKGNTYFLTDGSWHEINQALLNNLQNMLGSYLHEVSKKQGLYGSELLLWTSAKSETEYLKRFTKSTKHSSEWLVLHPNQFDYQGSRIEGADMIKIDPNSKLIKALFFVKSGDSFNSFSYVCRQLMRTGRLLGAKDFDKTFLSEIKKRLGVSCSLSSDIDLVILYNNKTSAKISNKVAHMMELQSVISESGSQLNRRCAAYLI